MRYGRAAVKRKIKIVRKMFGHTRGRGLGKNAREPTLGRDSLRGRVSHRTQRGGDGGFKLHPSAFILHPSAWVGDGLVDGRYALSVRWDNAPTLLWHWFSIDASTGQKPVSHFFNTLLSKIGPPLTAAGRPPRPAAVSRQAGGIGHGWTLPVGGLRENVAGVLPPRCDAVIHKSPWEPRGNRVG